MKKRLFIPIAALMLAASCEEKVPTWRGQDRINFQGSSESDTLRSYSFAFDDPEITQYTIYITVNTEGLVHDYPRTVAIRQVSTGSDDAAPDIHYVAFDDAQVSNQYVIPAGANSANFPIILLRHPDLLKTQKTLRIELVENDNFLLSRIDPNRLFRQIMFADKTVKPDIWDELIGVQAGVRLIFYFGTYGEAKHRFMIEATGMLFDNEWFSKYYYFQTGTWQTRDIDYMQYLARWLQERLNEQNAAAGLGNELKEADGTEVKFE